MSKTKSFFKVRECGTFLDYGLITFHNELYDIESKSYYLAPFTNWSQRVNQRLRFDFPLDIGVLCRRIQIVMRVYCLYTHLIFLL